MQIVIDMPEKEYQDVMRGRWEGNPLANYIENGTALPKGHGRLIDADELESRMKIGYCIVRDAPTIISADKAERSGEMPLPEPYKE